VFDEYSCFSSLSKFVQVIHTSICVCIQLLQSFTVQFICVINLFITYLNVLVVVLVHLKVAVGNFGHVFVTQRYRIIRHHQEVGKQIKGIFCKDFKPRQLT